MNKKLDEQVKTLEENWKRALADYQNLVKRMDGEKKEFVKFATGNLVAKFIPSLDVLELAALHSQDPGVKMAVKMLGDVLKDEGVITIEPKVGDEHNPLFEECIEVVGGEPDHTIAEVLQKGYRINDNFVIRPAKVKVFKSST